MPPRTDDTPTVVTFADHEVITPPHLLRKAVTPAAEGDDDPVARAEAALAQLASEFGGWMHSECERIEATRQELKRAGFTKETCEGLFRAAHDIKGEAATFGYPAVGAVAASLCRLIEHTPEMTRLPIELLDQHVDAIRAIVREHKAADLSGVAAALAQRLREVTDEFLRVENSNRPDYLRNVLAPLLSPGSSSG